MAMRIQLRRGTATQWVGINPILAEGEAGVDTTSHRIKFGDGINTWNNLPYSTMTSDEVYASVVDAIADNATVVAAAAAAVDANPVIASLTPGPGEVIVGGESGTVRRQLSWSGMEMKITDLSELVPAGNWNQDTWTSYDGANIIVHPSIRYFPEPFSGYHWWAAATPYAGSDIDLENPCVYVSEDGKNWVDAPGVSNPLIDNSAAGVDYNSDPYLTQDHDGRLLLYYREIGYLGVPYDRIRLFTSVDGATWDGPTTVYDVNPAVSAMVSPSIWWEASEQKWVMLGVDMLAANNYRLLRATSSTPEGPFTGTTSPTLSPAWGSGWRSWHLDILPIGSQLVGVLMAYNQNAPIATWNFLVQSNDGGHTWTRLADPLPDGGNVYKSAIIPAITERGLGLHVWQGRGAPAYNTRSVQFLPPSPAQMTGLQDLMAWSAIDPYVLGDNFNRPDNLTGLGIASSGQTWTTTLGTPGVQSGKARGVSGNSRAIINIGVADYEISARIEATPGVAGEAYFMARYGDSTSLLRCGLSQGTVLVEKISGGAPVSIIPGVGKPAGTYTIALRCEGDTFTLLIDGVEVGSVTDAFNLGATTVGINLGSTTKPLDDLKVKVI